MNSLKKKNSRISPVRVLPARVWFGFNDALRAVEGGCVPVGLDFSRVAASCATLGGVGLLQNYCSSEQ